MARSFHMRTKWKSMNIYFDQIVDCVREKYPTCESIFVYGSRARGTHRDDSDFDICVMMPSGTIPARYDRKLNEHITEKIGIETHIVFATMMNGWCEKQIFPKTTT